MHEPPAEWMRPRHSRPATTICSWRARPRRHDERPVRSASNGASTFAASGDRASIGRILGAAAQAGARTPYVVAGIFSAAWVLCLLGLAYGCQGAFGRSSPRAAAPSRSSWTPGRRLRTVAFFFALAHMLARAGSCVISQSMAEVAMRLAEPVAGRLDRRRRPGGAPRGGRDERRRRARLAPPSSVAGQQRGHALERAYNDSGAHPQPADGLAANARPGGRAGQVHRHHQRASRPLARHHLGEQAVADRVNGRRSASPTLSPRRAGTSRCARPRRH